MKTDLITVGKVIGHFGVQGWLKVFSFTQPMENITVYRDWIVGGQLYKGIKSKKHGKTVVVYFTGIDNRSKAEPFIGMEVAIETTQLKALPNDEYYWRDLVGLKVVDQEGNALGLVDSLFETGANDVLVVKDGETEVLIPFVDPETVKSVSLTEGVIVVDWQEAE